MNNNALRGQIKTNSTKEKISFARNCGFSIAINSPPFSASTKEIIVRNL
jgi:hypothetical protein